MKQSLRVLSYSLILFVITAKTSFALTPAEIFKLHSDSVVTIFCIDADGSESNGSGFFVENDGFIITNHHVIDGAKNIFVRLKNEDVFPITKVIAQDPDNDLALIQIDLQDTPKLKIAESIPAIGENIFVIGAPLGLSHSISSGLISSSRENNNLIQITAPVSPGSSGSPVFDLNGNVVGVISFSLSEGQNMNFAPSAYALRSFIRKKPMIAQEKTTNEGNTLLFVDKDNRYTIYLEKTMTTYSNNNLLISIWTMWVPTEAQKKDVAKSLGLTKKALSSFALNYVIDLAEKKGSHRRTINFYDDGSVARDYTVPKPKWESPSQNKRIRAFISVLEDLD
jgi:hypothetical protein